MPNGLRTWLMTRYEDVRRAMTDPRLHHDRASLPDVQPFAAVAPERKPGTVTLLDLDPPTHTRLRRLLADAFTQDRTHAFRPRLRAIADEVLDGLSERDGFDAVEDFVVPYIWRVNAELLGFDIAERFRLRRASSEISHLLLNGGDEHMDRPVRELHEAIGKFIEAKRAVPGDDWLTMLVQLRDNDDITEDELVAAAQLLLIAAEEGPVHAISTGIGLLLDNPAQLTALRRDPGLLPGVVDEILRLEAPLSMSMIRWADQPVTYSGVTIPAGEPILLAVLSTGRDPRRFECPEQFDPSRTDRRHLGFGRGRHTCMGAQLARYEVEIGLQALLDHFDELEPAGDAVWKLNVVGRGLATLPVRTRVGKERVS